MDETTTLRKLDLALCKLAEKDSYLFFNNVNERTLCARLAIYLEEEFANEKENLEYNVDCEYNKDFNAKPGFVKRLDSNKLRELSGRKVDSDDSNGVTVYPDIIIHKRGKNENLLVLEVKKSTNRDNRVIDIEKLKAYKEELGYTYARFIEFGTGEGDRDRILKNEPV